MFSERKLIMFKDAMQKPEVSFWMAIIIPLLGIAVQYGVFTTSFSENVKDTNQLKLDYQRHVEENEMDKKEQSLLMLQLQIKLAEIQKDVSYIRFSFTEDK